MFRQILIGLILLPIISYAHIVDKKIENIMVPPGKQMYDVSLPFKHQIAYTDWLGIEYGTARLWYDFSNLPPQRIKCDIENAYDVELRYEPQQTSQFNTINVKGSRSFIFVTGPVANVNEIAINNRSQMYFVEDHAPKEWKSYASCYFN